MGAQRLRSVDMECETEMEISNQEHNLNRQGSLYNLTLDEVQNQLCDLGKPLSSMNLDELLKTVWTAETNNQAHSSASYAASSSGLNPNPNILSGDLSKKTVDEVWQDIQDGQKRSNLERKSTLGEITLEDFLVKAGIVAESCGEVKKNVGLVSDPWMSYVNQSHSQSIFMPVLGVQQGVGFSDAQISMVSSPLMSTMSDTQTNGRKRVAS